MGIKKGHDLATEILDSLNDESQGEATSINESDQIPNSENDDNERTLPFIVGKGTKLQKANQQKKSLDTVSIEPLSGNYPNNEKEKTKIAVGVGHVAHSYQDKSHHGGGLHPSDFHLVQSENLRIAQARINALEAEVDRLREENESLAAAGKTLKSKSDEMSIRAENSDRKLKEAYAIFDEEKEILKNAILAKDKMIYELSGKVEELEGRLATDLRKIRVRERELENRLELLKMESSALVRSKDEYILDLKRQVDQLTSETDNYRNKCQDLYKQIESSREQFKRTVRALRIALAGLEGHESEDMDLIKKAK
jgi:predicted  nucleic acid-binding Zn-ribbon protein